MPSASSPRTDRLNVWLCLGFVTLLSLFTYVYRYNYPQAFFWDENYHVASAQKYLNGVYFMEQHPPLGKLLIALGEKLMHANARNDQFIGTDYAKNPPKDFRLTGYRLFPVLLAWLTAPLLFLCFWFMTRSVLGSTIFSFLYVFDNALIVHSRGAMLEGTQLFFGTATILTFLLALEKRERPRQFLLWSFLFGLSFGCVMTTKVVGLIFVLLVPAALWILRLRWRQCARFLLLFSVGFLLSYVAVWQTHFALGSRVVSANSDRGYYQASSSYKTILKSQTNGSLINFPTMLRDSIAFVSHYNNGVPGLDLCKADENGSPFFFWPFGARSINYRWETPDGKSYRYLYLVANPVVWGCGLAGIALAVVLLLSSFLAPPKQKLERPFLLLTFLALYLGYMAAVSRISRVMYLYHYFLPLLFSFFLFGLCVMEIRQVGRWKVTEYRRSVFLVVIGTAIFLSYQFYRPLTYYEPLTNAQMQRRSIVPLWDLHCVNCSRDTSMLTPQSGK